MSKTLSPKQIAFSTATINQEYMIFDFCEILPECKYAPLDGDVNCPELEEIVNNFNLKTLDGRYYGFKPFNKEAFTNKETAILRFSVENEYRKQLTSKGFTYSFRPFIDREESDIEELVEFMK